MRLALLGLGPIIVLGIGLVFEGRHGNVVFAARGPGYVTSATCAGCHEKAYEAWSGSHHGWALRIPSPENVLGDFDDAVFEHRGVRSKFSKRDGKFFVETDGPDGQRQPFEVKYTVGVAPLQQYLVGLDKGRLQVLDIAWDTERRRWYHLYPEQDLKVGDGLHWSGPYKNWKARCAECHQTNFVKGYDPKGQSYDSSWSDLAVGCEACHGPGEGHVAWAKDPDGFRNAGYSDVDQKGLTIAFGKANADTELQICATCHSRREPLGADSSRAGEPFADNYKLALLRECLYQAD